MTAANPFGEVDAWVPYTDTLLGPGNHLVTIIEQEDKTSSNGNPKLVIKYENANGSRRDWITYTENSLRSIVGLFEAAGVARPEDGEFDPDDHYRLSAKYRQRIVGKQVGAVVREEIDDYPDKETGRVIPGKTKIVTKGYVEPSRITDDMPADTRGLATSGSGVKDDTVPF